MVREFQPLNALYLTGLLWTPNEYPVNLQANRAQFRNFLLARTTIRWFNDGMTEIEQTRIQEREALIARISNLLESDQRFLAAWLEGSLGRGSFDAWSDIDLWTVVRDEDFAQVVSDRYAIMETMGSCVLKVESPQNGPANGIYLMAGFETASGIQLVDWYCQPASQACRSNSLAVFFIRPELSRMESWRSSMPEDGISAIFSRSRQGEDSLRSDEPYVAWHPNTEQDALNAGNLAWAMVMIQAKHIFRHPNEPGLPFESFLSKLVKKASGGVQTLRPSTIDMEGPSDRLDRLVDITGGIIRAVPADTKLKDGIIRYLNAVRQALPMDARAR